MIVTRVKGYGIGAPKIWTQALPQKLKFLQKVVCVLYPAGGEHIVGVLDTKVLWTYSWY
jgi:hypothetical protein